MRVLLCKTGHRMEKMIEEALQRVGVEVLEWIDNPESKDYDVGYVQELLKNIRENKISLVWSMGYFPVLSRGCTISRIPYVAWEIGESWNALYSETIKSPWNYIFISEERIVEGLWKKNPGHIFNLQPGVNSKEEYYAHGVWICNMEKYPAYYWRKDCSEYVKGYTRGVIEAQKRVYGYHFLTKLLNGRYLTEMGKVLSEPNMGGDYSKKRTRVILEDFLCDAITQSEREEALDRIKRLGLYKETKISEINISIASRKCLTGIPYEMLQVMGAGGFVLTNYQEGIAEAFCIGEEIVVYESMKDMEDKLLYYSEHVEERRRIAENGRCRVQKDFRLEERLGEIFDTVLKALKNLS